MNALPGKECSTSRIPVIFVGCKYSNFGTVSLHKPTWFRQLGYQYASQAPAATRGKYAACCHILRDRHALPHCDRLCVLNVGMRARDAGTHDVALAVVYVSLCFLCSTAVHANRRDIIFLLDGSFNVGKANFPYVRDFVMNVVNNLDVGSDNIRVGLVQFSDTPVTEFSLNTYQTKSDLLAHLRQLQLKGGSGLNTGSALSYVHANHFTEAGGSRIREHVPQLLLLLTAGRSEDAYLPAANALARAGVLTFCVGANQANRAELEQIAFNPSLVYLMDDFSSLPALPQQLIQPLTTYVSGGVEEVPLAQPGKAPHLRGAPFPQHVPRGQVAQSEPRSVLNCRKETGLLRWKCFGWGLETRYQQVLILSQGGSFVKESLETPASVPPISTCLL